MALGILYLLKTIKYSDCVKKKRRQIQVIETESPRAQLVAHEVQTASGQTASGQGYATIKETSETDVKAVAADNGSVEVSSGL